MSLEFNLIGLLVALAWAFSLPLRALPAVIIAALVFSSGSVPVSILFLISLTGVSFVEAILGGKKKNTGVTQRRYFVTFLGLFIALFGAALASGPLSLPLVFFGLLLSTVNGLNTFFFSEHYEKLRLSSYLSSAVLPSLVAIDILLKVKSGMKAEAAPVWNFSLIGLGLLTLLSGVSLSLVKRRLKPILIYFSQVWLGILFLLLVSESEDLSPIVFAAISVLVISSSILLELGSQLGSRYFSAAKIFALGLPGTIGFAAVFYSVKMIFGLGFAWLLPFGLAYFFLAIPILGMESGLVSELKRTRLRFWLIAAVQVVSGIGLLVLEKGLFK